MIYLYLKIFVIVKEYNILKIKYHRLQKKNMQMRVCQAKKPFLYSKGSVNCLYKQTIEKGKIFVNMWMACWSQDFIKSSEM